MEINTYHKRIVHLIQPQTCYRYQCNPSPQGEGVDGEGKGAAGGPMDMCDRASDKK